jgi:hypothetical protein
MARSVSDIIPRIGWGPGPWDGEPDRFEWVDDATGFPCLVVRHPLFGSLCGYVAVPPGNPFWGLDRTADPVRGLDVHDNVTYAASCMDVADIPEGAQESEWFHPELLVCHVPEPGQPDDVWWLGFAASHHTDVQPGADARLRDSGGADILDRINSARGPFRRRYRGLDFMRGECARLAAQLCEAPA